MRRAARGRRHLPDRRRAPRDAEDLAALDVCALAGGGARRDRRRRGGQPRLRGRDRPIRAARPRLALPAGREHRDRRAFRLRLAVDVAFPGVGVHADRGGALPVLGGDPRRNRRDVRALSTGRLRRLDQRPPHRLTLAAGGDRRPCSQAVRVRARPSGLRPLAARRDRARQRRALRHGVPPGPPPGRRWSSASSHRRRAARARHGAAIRERSPPARQGRARSRQSRTGPSPGRTGAHR